MTMFITGPKITIASSEVVVRPIESIPDPHDIIKKGKTHFLLKLGRTGYQKEAVLTREAAEALRDQLVNQLSPPGA